MSKVFVIGKKQLRLVGLAILLVILAYSFWVWNQAETAAGKVDEPRVIHMVTGEYATTTKEGKELEVYRWDPGTIFVKEGELIELRILGVNGERHPFEIEGLNIRGEVLKGKETVVTFRADQEGIYRIVCPTHHDPAHGGPMVGYLIVD